MFMPTTDIAHVNELTPDLASKKAALDMWVGRSRRLFRALYISHRHEYLLSAHFFYLDAMHVPELGHGQVDGENCSHLLISHAHFV